MKKLLLTLGTVAAVAAPVASVIACGSEDTSKLQHFATHADFVAANLKKPAASSVDNKLDAKSINVIAFIKPTEISALTDLLSTFDQADFENNVEPVTEKVAAAIGVAYDTELKITDGDTNPMGSGKQVSFGTYVSYADKANTSAKDSVILLQINNVTQAQAVKIIKAATIAGDSDEAKVLAYVKTLV